MKNESQEFTIPFNRQQLADYLSVDRSAMSNELGKMQRERLIRVDKKSLLSGETGRVPICLDISYLWC